MNFVDLTMPLNHRWMPDEGLPTAIKFFLGPKDHQEKGMVVGSDSGTSLALPSLFAEFRKTTRLDQVPVEKLFLRPAVVAHINKGDGQEISKSDVEMAFARSGIMTVRKLVQCGQIKSQRIKLLVSPLNIVRGVASSCRVVAVEE